MKTASCSLCGSVHVVPMFDGKESEDVKCQTCGGYFRFTAPATKGGDFGTRTADRMTDGSSAK